MEDLDLGATLKGFAPGQKVFNRYTLQKILGRGGMGVVWLARDEELERAVALKFLPEIVALDPEALSDLKRETRRNLDLTHPHIVRIYDFVSDSRTAAISMEYVDGASLAALKLDRPGRVFTVAELTSWLEQLGTALTYAHTKAKIVHRDLKPANLMITRSGELKITDFGIARGISDSVSRVSAQLAGSSGTPVYMSPQQMMGERAAVTDDIYAIGATLYELLTGKPPFHSGNIIMQVQAKVPPSLAERRAELGVTGEAIPAAWERAVAACLAKEATDRPGSMADLMARLRGGDAEAAAALPPVMPPPAVEPAATPPPLPAPSSKLAGNDNSTIRRWLLAPMVAALLPALAGVTFFLGCRSLGYFWTWGHWGQYGLMVLGLVWLALAGAAVIVLKFWRWRGGRTHDGWIGLGALLGGLTSASVILFIAWTWVGRLDQDSTWTIFNGEILVGGLAGAVVGAAGAYLLRRIAEGVPAGKPWLAAGVFAGGALCSGLVFGEFLPWQMDATYVQERDRQNQKWAAQVAQLDSQNSIEAEQDRLRREAADARVREEAAAQRALREQQAVGLAREAYRMVFDRAPDAATVTRYTTLLLDNPNWDAARLRQELRSSPDGSKGGRLLVPEEFATIRAAVDAAVPGNAVHVAPGVYREQINLKKAVSLIGAGRDRVTVEVAASLNALHVESAHGVVVRGFTFRHTTTEDVERRSFVVGITDSSLDFEDNAVVDGNGNGLIIRGSGSSTVRRSIFRGQRWNGVTLYAGATGAVTDNVMENNRECGLSVLEPAGRMEIARNTVTGSGYQGIWIGEGDNVTLANNRVSSNGTVGQRYGGIGIGKGRPVLNGNVSSDNIGSGIWWNNEAQPVINRGNLSDGTELAAP